MDTYDITGLDPKSAAEYVLAAITTLKATQEKRTELELEAALWAKRKELAGEHGKEDLLLRAEARANQVKEDLDRIKLEEAELNGGVIRLKGQLKLIRNQPELNMDTDQLVAELELMEDDLKQDELSEKFREEEANDALANLKEQMEKEEQGE